MTKHKSRNMVKHGSTWLNHHVLRHFSSNSRWLIFFEAKKLNYWRRICGKDAGWFSGAHAVGVSTYCYPESYTYIYIYVCICAGLAPIIMIIYIYIICLLISDSCAHFIIYICVCVRSKVNPHSFRIASAFKNAFDFVARRSS